MNEHKSFECDSLFFCYDDISWCRTLRILLQNYRRYGKVKDICRDCGNILIEEPFVSKSIFNVLGYSRKRGQYIPHDTREQKTIILVPQSFKYNREFPLFQGVNRFTFFTIKSINLFFPESRVKINVAILYFVDLIIAIIKVSLSHKCISIAIKLYCLINCIH